MAEATAPAQLPMSAPGGVRSIGPRRLEANRQNALRSTGPRTPAGKATTSRNALRHGLRALTPVVPGLEREGDWQAHRAGVTASLTPEGYLQECLADRVALQLWRLARLVRYERELLGSLYKEAPGVVSQRREEGQFGSGSSEPSSLADAEATVARWRETRRLIESIPDIADGAELPGTAIFEVAVFLTRLVDRYTSELTVGFSDGTGVPLDDLGLDPGPWPATALRSIADHLAGDVGRTSFLAAPTDEAIRQEGIAEEARRAIRAEVQGIRRQGILPDEVELDKLSRYEAALERSLMRTLHELQRLQAARQGGIMAPLALDVDFASS